MRRDSVWPHQAGDLTWLTEHPVMPLNIGQYVNNHSPGEFSRVLFTETQNVNLMLNCYVSVHTKGETTQLAQYPAPKHLF